MTLRTKFYLASLCLIFTVVVGMMTSLFLSEKKRLREDMTQEQVENLHKIARVCKDSMAVFDEPALLKYARNLVELSAPKLVYAGFVYPTQQGGLPWVWRHDSNRIVYVDPFSDEVRAVLGSSGIVRRAFVLNGERIVELSEPVGKYGFVRLGYSQKVVEQIFRQTIAKSIKRFSIVGLIATAVGLILASFFSAALSRPILNLKAAADAIARGKKGVKVTADGEDELGQLANTFNRMSGELEKLDQMKDDFMSHVTHELRSPLTSIIATAELMSEMEAVNKDTKMRRSVDRLMFGSERLNRLVDNILDLTRLEAGKMPFDIHPVDLRKVLVEMADFFEPRAMEKALAVRASVPDAFPLVLADVERIRQVLSNLIYNAIKFTNKGSITLLLREQDGMATVEVKDTGVGIAKNKLNTVFEKFECLKETRDRVEKPVPGSGLGLNIVQNSIKAQNGKIWVESEIDQGSSFIYQLPFAPAEQSSVTASAPRVVGAVTLPPMSLGPTAIAASQKTIRL
jgi:signal transduction histidine kinase